MSIKQVRQRMRMTQAEFAQLCGTDRSELSRIQSARVPDWLMKAIRLNRLLQKEGLSLNDLLLSLPDPEDRPTIKES